MTFIEFKAIIKETRLHLKTIWTCWISASSLNFTFQRWKPRSRAFRGRCVRVCVRIACICGCVCNIPESVRGMRITSDRGRMWRLLLPCEGRCCLLTDSCRRSCSAVCVCVFVSFIVSLPENVGVASHFWHNCVSCKLHYNFGACNSWYSIYLHLYFKQIIGEINLLSVHEKAGLLWRATPMS